MSRFDRYLLSQLLALFGFFSLVLVAVYWVNRAVSLFDRIIGDGHSLLIFLEISALTLPNVIRIVLPVSAFVATVYLTNRLTQESELVVMQGTGFSPFRLARPVMVFGLIVTGFMLVLMNVIVPESRSTLSAREATMNENVTARFLKEGQFLHPDDGVTVFIRDINERGELLDVFLSDEREAADRRIYTARSAILARTDDGPKLLMFDGMVQRLGADRRISVTRFSDVTYSLREMIAQSRSSAGDIESYTTWAMLTAEARANWSDATLAQELHSRLAQPFLALAATLIGFSTLLLGAFSRFGLWRQIAGAVVMLIGMQLLTTVFNAEVQRNAAAWPLLYIAPLSGIVAATMILWLSGRERRVAAPLGPEEAA